MGNRAGKRGLNVCGTQQTQKSCFCFGGFLFLSFFFFLHGVGFCSFVSFRFSKVCIFKTVNLNIEVNFNVKDIK